MDASPDQPDGGGQQQQPGGSGARHHQVTSMTFFMPFPNQGGADNAAPADGQPPPRPNGISWTIQVVAEGEGNGAEQPGAGEPASAAGGEPGADAPAASPGPSSPIFLLDPRNFPGGVPPFFHFMAGGGGPPARPDPAKAAELLRSVPTVSRELMRRVDKVEAAEADDSASGWRCAVCFEGVEHEEGETGVKALPCNHLFHASCLEPWFLSKHTCPTCRLDLDPMRTLEPPRRVFSRPGPTGTPRAPGHPYMRPSRPFTPPSRPSSRPQTPSGDAAASSAHTGGSSTSVPAAQPPDFSNMPSVGIASSAPASLAPPRIFAPLPLRASPQPLDFAALAAQVLMAPSPPPVGSPTNAAPGTPSQAPFGPGPLLRRTASAALAERAAAATSSTATTVSSASAAAAVPISPAAPASSAAPSAANLFASSVDANPSLTHYSLPRSVRSVQVTMRPARLNRRASPPVASSSGPTDAESAAQVSSGEGSASTSSVPAGPASPAAPTEAAPQPAPEIAPEPAPEPAAEVLSADPGMATAEEPAAATLDRLSPPPENHDTAAQPLPTSLPPMMLSPDAVVDTDQPLRPDSQPPHASAPPTGPRPPRPPQRAHRLPFPFSLLFPPGMLRDGPPGLPGLARAPGTPGNGEPAAAPAGADAAVPTADAPADGQGPGRQPSPRATLPEPKVTLEAWTTARERSLGWRCDAVECGYDLDDEAAGADAAGADAADEAHAAHAPASAAKHAPPARALVRVLGDDGEPVCEHGWHRACLESAGRSAGQWAQDGNRVWVRCGRCRRDGWVAA